MEQVKRKPGRPRKYPLDEPRATYSMRLRSRTMDAIKASAVNNGRSISEEIELRLELSLAEERLDLSPGTLIAALA